MVSEVLELTNFLSDSTTSKLGYSLIFVFFVMDYILEMIDTKTNRKTPYYNR